VSQEGSGQEAAYHVLLNSPRTAQDCLMAIHVINYEVPFIKLKCPALV